MSDCWSPLPDRSSCCVNSARCPVQLRRDVGRTWAGRGPKLCRWVSHKSLSETRPWRHRDSFSHCDKMWQANLNINSTVVPFFFRSFSTWSKWMHSNQGLFFNCCDFDMKWFPNSPDFQLWKLRAVLSFFSRTASRVCAAKGHFKTEKGAWTRLELTNSQICYYVSADLRDRRAQTRMMDDDGYLP